MIVGVLVVVVLYVAVNAACLRALGIGGLAATNTPASQIAQLAFGKVGLRVMATVIALSTLGFLSNQILTSPRVYFQMAADRDVLPAARFGESADFMPPSLPSCCKGVIAIVIALSGRYDREFSTT